MSGSPQGANVYSQSRGRWRRAEKAGLGEGGSRFRGSVRGGPKGWRKVELLGLGESSWGFRKRTKVQRNLESILGLSDTP